jgi:hypothetical protein
MMQPIWHAFVRVGRAFKYAQNSWYEAWRVFRGFLALLVPLAVLGFVILTVDLLRTWFELERESFLGMQAEWLVGMLVLMAMTIVMAVFIVYFLRLLNWLKTHGRAFWNEETAPHHQGNHTSHGRPRVNRPLSEAKFKFIEWSTLSLLIWLTFAVFVLMGFAVNSVIGWGIPDFGPTLQNSALQFLEQVPVVGQIIAFDYYPGDGPLGTASYFVGAIPVAIAIRNLIFIIEYIEEFDTTQDENLVEVIGLSCVVILMAVAVFSVLGVIVWAIDTTVDAF